MAKVILSHSINNSSSFISPTVDDDDDDGDDDDEGRQYIIVSAIILPFVFKKAVQIQELVKELEHVFDNKFISLVIKPCKNVRESIPETLMYFLFGTTTNDDNEDFSLG